VRSRTAPCLLAAAAAAAAWLPPATPVTAGRQRPIEWELVGTYATGLADVEAGLTSGEVAALNGDLLFVSNASDVSVDIVDVSDPGSPALVERVDLAAYGESVTSVAASKRLVAVTVESGTSPGRLVVFSHGGDGIRTAVVGAGPDMVTFTPNGGHILVANEGEPSGYEDGDIDPAGSVSLVQATRRGPLWVHDIGFDEFDPGRPRAGELPGDVRIYGSPLPSLDLEPEYVTVADDGRRAWVSLQENNAIAVLDLRSGRVERISSLGFKDHSLPANGFDASDRDGGINIQPWEQVLGMFQPDALAAFRVRGRDYVLSANEGDAREYDGLDEAARLSDTTTDESFGPTRADEQLGRLNVTTAAPGAPSDQSVGYSFGARSFSVWDASKGDLVFDSGEALEQHTAAALPDNFNSNNDENSFDNRSDDKGPEPEAAAVGKVGGRTYGFVGLERIGGVVVVDLSDPASPVIVQYLQNRDFSGGEIGPDSGPEVIDFVPAGQSPNGKPMIAVANEITGTVSMYSPG
jgi:hypothetical protein